MLEIYGVRGDECEELVQIAREARQKGWWHAYSTVLTGAYVGLEQAAEAVRAYEQQVMPGLLQTEEYAKAMIRAARPDITTDEVERRVRVRLNRQSLLTQDDPIDLWVVLDEAVLSRPIGGDAVMCAQLERLIEAAELPNVTLQVLPFEVGAHAGMDGTFTILTFSEPSDPGWFLPKMPPEVCSWRRVRSCGSTCSFSITSAPRPSVRRSPWHSSES
ncbi:hypothetical protein Psuf_032010 [Phytohabitans suffuscus]|uniref:DUF5753 domain-containing protein n=1 Tax=Phytohabitans suffuscus TaxID=624315 RepID=A0A6F8YIU4_9ACTN|nr:hypothetical protein Psuf_032010 [Phytohabitans suffuscus]